MEYATLAEVYERLRSTNSTDEKVEILASFLSRLDRELLDRVVVLVRGQVFPDHRSNELGISSKLAVVAIARATGLEEDRIETWWREEGDLGDAARAAKTEARQRSLLNRSLTVERVHETLASLQDFEGEGSRRRRIDTVAGLVSDADPVEAKYVIRTVLGTLRLGVGPGLVRDAIAEAFLDGSAHAIEVVERAYEVTNDLGLVAGVAREAGQDGLDDLDVRLFRPVKPMLAHGADTLAGAIGRLGDDSGEVLVETKYDGIRAKIHADGGSVRIFTRRLDDVTAQFPEVEESTEDLLGERTVIIEAELVGHDSTTGDPVPFQQLSRRIKRKHEIDRLASAIPVTAFCFDLLFLDDRPLLDDALDDRLEKLDPLLEGDVSGLERARHRRVDSVEEAREVFDASLAAGHEGVMVKNLDAPYQPGSRVGYQLKVKPSMDTLDLVVTRAKWSEGRKSEFLGRPYLACRDEEAGTFREVGRMHSGFTDEELRELTDRLTPLIRSVDGREARVTPRVVLEVEFEEIQHSPTYDAGYALRFPRLQRIRDDLTPADVDTLSTVVERFEAQSKVADEG